VPIPVYNAHVVIECYHVAVNRQLLGLESKSRIGISGKGLSLLEDGALVGSHAPQAEV